MLRHSVVYGACKVLLEALVLVFISIQGLRISGANPGSLKIRARLGVPAIVEPHSHACINDRPSRVGCRDACYRLNCSWWSGPVEA